MSNSKADTGAFINLRDIYVAVAESVASANRELEGAGSDISYAVVESDIAIAYETIARFGDDLRVRLPGSERLAEALPTITMKVRPIPNVVPEKAGEKQQPVSVPPLTGMSLDESLGALFSSGLRVGQIIFDPRAKPAGSIISQEPSAGSVVDPGEKVNIHVAGESLKIAIPPESVKPVQPKKPGTTKTPSGRKKK